MPRVTAGRRYPHATTDARPHNHRFCPVIGKIADSVRAGAEEWGTPHEWPVPSETIADEVKRAFYAARYCAQLGRRFGEMMSIQAGYRPREGGGYYVWVRVWPRSIARKEMARRVKAGEPLAYNVMRST